MITREKMLWSFIKLSPFISKEMYEDQAEQFESSDWGLKGWFVVRLELPISEEFLAFEVKLTETYRDLYPQKSIFRW